MMQVSAAIAGRTKGKKPHRSVTLHR